jgi:hypothetical protein
MKHPMSELIPKEDGNYEINIEWGKDYLVLITNDNFKEEDAIQFNKAFAEIKELGLPTVTMFAGSKIKHAFIREKTKEELEESKK